MSKQSQDRNQSKRAARLFKKHETAYRALINLLIRQVERELLDELQQPAPQPGPPHRTEVRKDDA